MMANSLSHEPCVGTGPNMSLGSLFRRARERNLLALTTTRQSNPSGARQSFSTGGSQIVGSVASILQEVVEDDLPLNDEENSGVDHFGFIHGDATVSLDAPGRLTREPSRMTSTSAMTTRSPTSEQRLDEIQDLAPQ